MSKKTTVSKEPESELQQLEQKLAHDIDEITKPENAYANLYKKRLEETTKKLSQAYQRIAELEVARDEILGLQNNTVVIPEWVKSSQSNGYVVSDNIPILLASDWHYGEVIDSKEMPNGNCYNTKVADLRIQRLTKGVIAKISAKNKSVRGIVVCFLGDDISGDIHDELKETNAATAMESVLLVAAQKTKMLQELQKAFGNVWVISVPGNHGRNTIKMPSKNLVGHNYDTLVTMMVEAQLRSNPNIQFFTPKSGEAYFTINNTNFMATHGDRIGSRGGQGFIGPSATIARGQHKTRQAYAQIGKAIDWLLIGHFHVPLQLEHTLANGTLVGYNQYARDLRVEPDFPSQTLFMVDPRYGVTDVSRIYVTNRENIGKDKELFRRGTKVVLTHSIATPAWIKENHR